MKDIAISIDRIAKHYQIYGRPQDRLKQSLIPRLRRLVRRPERQYFQTFCALRDISFDVHKGATMGIIGRNGSGKSTLLQIICGTLSPTSGSVEVNGRVAALLELGSGFNPEFTGRENVFLNGMVLGLTQNEIEERFSSISTFAGIGEYIEQPVKTYSSGMMLRLAFAVIAHVDADVLVIDEALSVGDAVFSQKCMRFLKRFQESGTVLFVSHDSASIVGLCSEAVWLDKGQIRMKGKAKDVAEAYAQFCAQEALGDAQEITSLQQEDAREQIPATASDSDIQIEFFDNIIHSDGWTTGKARIESVKLARCDGRQEPVFAGGERVNLLVEATTDAGIARPIIGFIVKDKLGQSLFGHNTSEQAHGIPGIDRGGTLQARFQFALPLLPNGEYSMTVAIADGDLSDHVQHHWIHDAVIIAVNSTQPRYGLVGIPFESISVRLIERDTRNRHV